MSNQRLPAELLDQIVDLLYDSRDALKSCSLVSKSWIPRARKHIFADIKFSTAEDLQSWRTTFPDPSTSPACYTRILAIECLQAIVAADAEEGGWITTFTHVVDFTVNAESMSTDRFPISLLLFYGFSPGLKSLDLTLFAVPFSQFFGLVCSFPLLEDLSVTNYDGWIESNNDSDDQGIAVQPSVSPVFTGRLGFNLGTGLDFVVSWLSSLRGGLHFRSLRSSLCQQRDDLPVMVLVERCRSTLEYLEIESELFGTSVRCSRPH